MSLLSIIVIPRTSLIFSGLHSLYFSKGEKQHNLIFLLGLTNRWGWGSLKILSTFPLHYSHVQDKVGFERLWL